MALTTNVPSAIRQTTSYMMNGMSSDITGVEFPQQTGVPIQSLYIFKVIPAAFNATCVSNANTWNAGGQPLNQRNVGTFPNCISQALNTSNPLAIAIGLGGVSGVLLDCERSLTLTFGGGSVINPTVVTVTGYDYLGNALSFSQSLGSSQSTPVVLSTPISVVTSVVFSPTFESEGGGGLQTVSIGNSNRIGLPYYLSNISHVLMANWQGTFLNVDTNVVAGFDWRLSAPSLTSGTPRGYVNLPTNTDGTSQLSCCYYVHGSDSEVNAELNVANQSTIKIAQVVENTSNQNVLPFLTQYDLTGVVYPADSAFIYSYQQLKTA